MRTGLLGYPWAAAVTGSSRSVHSIRAMIVSAGPKARRRCFFTGVMLLVREAVSPREGRAPLARSRPLKNLILR